MNLRKAISKDAIVLELQGETKDEVLEELLDLIINIGQIKDRKTVMHQAIGWRDVQTKEPLVPHTIVNIRSMTKAVTRSSCGPIPTWKPILPQPQRMNR